MNQLFAVLIDGIVYASWLFIIAVGLTLIYGVMKILNIAHGSLYALGAFTAVSFCSAWFSHNYGQRAASRCSPRPRSWSG